MHARFKRSFSLFAVVALVDGVVDLGCGGGGSATGPGAGGSESRASAGASSSPSGGSAAASSNDGSSASSGPDTSGASSASSAGSSASSASGASGAGGSSADSSSGASGNSSGATSASSSGTGGPGPGPNDGGAPAPDDGGVAVSPNNLAKCAGSNPIACHFGGSPGNYDVTVVLGGSAAAETSVMAEISREMLGPVATGANQTAHYTTVVNVRQPEGQPVADKGNPASGLDLYFWGANGKSAAVSGIGFAPAKAPIVVYLATDSTGCDQGFTAYAGWGQWLPQYFTSPISIANYGNSGVDTQTVAAGSAYWPAMQALITAKDFLLIELGDNDKNDTAAAITQALTTMITGAKAKGAAPILMTPVQRALFTGSNVNPYLTNSTGANVPTLMKQLGQSQNVPVLDLTTRTTTWLQGLGPNGWHPYFAFNSGTSKYDSTHLNQTGASIVAGFVRDLIKEASIPVLSTYLR